MVDFRKLESRCSSLRHSGDDVTGDGKGDVRFHVYSIVWRQAACVQAGKAGREREAGRRNRADSNGGWRRCSVACMHACLCVRATAYWLINWLVRRTRSSTSISVAFRKR